MTPLVIVGDQALSVRELATRERLRAWGRKRYRERMATDPEYARRRRDSHKRYRDRRGEEWKSYHREWMRQYRASQRADAQPIRIVASLHDLRCTGPTRSTGCRCHKVTIYERVESAA